MPRNREPAWGERDAITGYYPQYRISAAQVIRALRDDTLQWIAVADPKAGRVDDFQIGSDQRVLNLDTHDDLAVVQILSTQNAATSARSRSKNEGVPE